MLVGPVLIDFLVVLGDVGVDGHYGGLMGCCLRDDGVHEFVVEIGQREKPTGNNTSLQ